MVNIYPKIEKPYWNFREDLPTPEEVGVFLKELNKELKELENLPWRIQERVSINDEYLKRVKESYKEMINLCKFYFEIRKRKKKGELFVWKTEKEDKPDHYEYNKEEKITCSNGKIKFIIEIKRGIGKMDLIEYWQENDTKLITFDWSDYPYSKRVSKHLKSEEKIKEYIESLKKMAFERFKDYEIPRSLKRERDFEDKMMGVEDENQGTN